MKHKIYFHLGLNTKVAPRFLKDGECSIAQDCYFDEYGSVFSRKFKTNYISLDKKICSMFPYSDALFINAFGDLYLNNKLIGTGYGSNPFTHIEYNGILYAVNTLKQISYNGSNIYNMGIMAPEIAAQVADSGVAGNPDGTYTYKYTFTDIGERESNPSPVSSGVTVVTNKVNVIPLPSSESKIADINIYRAGAAYKLVDSVRNSDAQDGTVIAHKDSDDQGGTYNKIYASSEYVFVANSTLGIMSYTVDATGAFTYKDADAPAGGGVFYDIHGKVSDRLVFLTSTTTGLHSYSYSALAAALSEQDSITVGSIVDFRCVYYLDSASSDIVIACGYDGSDTSLFSFLFNAGGLFTHEATRVIANNEPQAVCCTDDNLIFTVGDGGWWCHRYTEAPTDFFSEKSSSSTYPNLESVCAFSDHSKVFFADSGNIYVYSFDSFGNATYLNSYTGLGDNIYDLYTDGQYLYASNDEAGLRTFLIFEDGSLTLMDTNDQGGEYKGVYSFGGYTIIAAGTSGILSASFGYVYVDNVSDADTTDLLTADSNGPPPSSLSYLIEHYERGIGAKSNDYPNSIWFSTEYEPEYWGDGTSQQYLLGNTNPCTGLLSWGRYVVYFKKKEIYVMEGTDPTSWHRRRSDSSKGNIAPRCISFWRLPIFCSNDGLYFFDINAEISFSDKVESFFSKSGLENAVGRVYNNKYYFSYDGSETLVYDLLNKVFYTYKFGINAIAEDLNNIFYCAIDSDIIKLDQDLNDDNESVQFNIKSRAVELEDGKTGYLKDYMLDIDTSSEDITLNVYIDDNLKQAININTPKMETVYRNFNAGLKGRYAEFEFVYTGTKEIKIKPPLCLNRLDS